MLFIENGISTKQYGQILDNNSAPPLSLPELNSIIDQAEHPIWQPPEMWGHHATVECHVMQKIVKSNNFSQENPTN